MYVGYGVDLLAFLQQSLNDPDVTFSGRDVNTASPALPK